MDVGGAGGGSSNCAVEKEMEEVTDHDAQVADATDVDLKGSSAGSSVDGADVDHLAQESWRCLKECRRSWFVREIVRMTRLAVPSVRLFGAWRLQM